MIFGRPDLAKIEKPPVIIILRALFPIICDITAQHLGPNFLFYIPSDTTSPGGQS